MSKPVPAGARAEVEMTVELKHTLAGIHASFPPVLSTPQMIQLMEEACFWALHPFQESDEITVGTHINVSHGRQSEGRGGDGVVRRAFLHYAGPRLGRKRRDRQRDREPRLRERGEIYGAGEAEGCMNRFVICNL
jgi:hypothetical protein